LETSEIILTNYRDFLIDIKLENYFKDKLSYWNQINYYALNLGRTMYGY